MFSAQGIEVPTALRLEGRVLRALSIGFERVKRRVDRAYQERCLRQVGVNAVDAIPTYTTKLELKALYTMAAACPRGATAIEIGSYLGASTCYIAAGIARVGGHLYCVDTWQNETMPDGEKDTFAEFQQNTAAIERWITTVRKRSYELSATDFRAPIHLVFIDGDHNYAAVKRDLDHIKKWVALDGIIAFHDCIAFKGVSRVIGEALGSGEWKIAGHVENLLWVRRANWER